MLADTYMYIDDKYCTLQEIVCFDGNASKKGAYVYYVTDIGTYIKYYEHEKDQQPVTLSEEEFKKYGVEYYEYSISYENNYSEDGSPLYGGVTTFKSYIKNRGDYIKNSNSGKWLQNTDEYIVYIVGTIILVLLGYRIVNVIKRKK